MTGFGAAAWQRSPRDKFIGWNHEQRKRTLHLIVNNARFLILPWVESKSLAPKILSLHTRQLSYDWGGKYNIRPVVMESFVKKTGLQVPAIKQPTGIMSDKLRNV